jgi:hypothetical protein
MQGWFLCLLRKNGYRKQKKNKKQGEISHINGFNLK